MLYLALSCLQGRTMNDAAESLLSLAPGEIGLQLTPGCAPSPIDVNCPKRTHHGYTPFAIRAMVWNGGTMIWHGDSVHPPLKRNVADNWLAPNDIVMETMYPGYADLANGEQIAAAMDSGRHLAVDVAHLEIQRFHGILSDSILNRILEYDRVAEVHVSTSHEHRDTHARLTVPTWGIEWARERLNVGTPVILECYMHHMTDAERRQQLEMIRG